MNILQSYVCISVNDIYENLVVKSVGLNLFSLLCSSFSSGVDASSFGCVVILSLNVNVMWQVPVAARSKILCF
jgi:hypothetical protein